MQLRLEKSLHTHQVLFTDELQKIILSVDSYVLKFLFNVKVTKHKSHKLPALIKSVILINILQTVRLYPQFNWPASSHLYLYSLSIIQDNNNKQSIFQLVGGLWVY